MMIPVLSDHHDVGNVKSVLLDSKVVGFKKLYLTIDEQADFMRNLCLHHGFDQGVYAIEGLTKTLSEDLLAHTFHVPLDTIPSTWHSDNTDMDCPPSHISMTMTKYENCEGEGVGNTFFVDLEQAYEDCPERIKEKLDSIQIHHMTGQGGDGIVCPAYRMHPDTGKVCLYVSDFGMTAVPESTIFINEYMLWLREYFTNNSFYWDWDEGDLLVWDNRNLIHGISGGWKWGDRVYNKVNGGDSRPIFYDRTVVEQLVQTILTQAGLSLPDQTTL